MGRGREFAGVIALVLGAVVGVADAAESVVLAAAGPQPAAGSLQPGLAPAYFYGLRVNSIREFYKQPAKAGKPGPPLLEINYRSGSGNVLTSESHDLVAARIEGFIHLDVAGVYEIAFESNDGVRLEVAGKLVVEDPDVHSDQFSEVGTLEVAEPGWYPVVIWYFEKKNTSTLRFLWRKPGTAKNAKMTVVPAQALAHAG